MTGRRASTPSTDLYSPERRTALLLTGVGTAGAYHAGVLRALQEAGVKIDVVAGRGIGAVSALFAAVDGAQRLWEERGFWRSPRVAGLYPWRGVLRLAGGAMGLAVALVAAPLVAVAAGLIVFPVDFLLKLVGVTAASAPATAYMELVSRAFAPTALPTWLPRLAVVTVAIALIAAVSAAWAARETRQARGAAWWRLLRAPLACVNQPCGWLHDTPCPTRSPLAPTIGSINWWYASSYPRPINSTSECRRSDRASKPPPKSSGPTGLCAG